MPQNKIGSVIKEKEKADVNYGSTDGILQKCSAGRLRIVGNFPVLTVIKHSI